MSFIRDKRVRWLLLVFLASVPLLGWWTTGLFDLDEGFYAAVVGSMIRRNEWITPFYNGQPWFEKPILLYWLAKPTVMLFGEAVGPRLPSVLATVATYGLVAWFARRRLGALSGVLSLFIMGGSLLPVAVGRMMMTDAPLMFCMTAAMLTFWESLVSNPRWRILTAGFLGLAVLAKGPVALIFFALIAGWTGWRILGPASESGVPTRRSLTGGWLLGTVVLFAVIASWYVPAYLANGQLFVDEFLIKQNLGRFTGGDRAHSVPFIKGFYFYVPILLVGMFPWSLFIPAAWPRRAVRDLTEPEMLKRYLAAWAAIIFIFFSISSAKLAHYVLPCCPPLALLLGAYFAERWQGLDRAKIRPRLLLMAGWLVAVWAVAQFGFQYWYTKSGQKEAHETARLIRSKYSGDSVLAFQLPRRNKDYGTGKLEIQETSLPSLSFYLDQDVVSLENFSDLWMQPSPAVIFTRPGRISEQQLREGPPTGRSRKIDRIGTGQHYDAYLMSELPIAIQ